MDTPRPGEWMALSDQQYERLVRLARRRLVGWELHAEDVVSRALLRWQAMPRDLPRARIETLIRSEAYSVLRSEKRRSEREHRASNDRATAFNHLAHQLVAGDALPTIKLDIARACRQSGIPISALDLEVLELLFAGYTVADATRAMALPRHVVKRSRERWRQILSIALDAAHDQRQVP